MKQKFGKILTLLRYNHKLISIVIIMTFLSFSMLLYKMQERKLPLPSTQASIVLGIFFLLTIIVVAILFWAQKKHWKIERIFLIFGLFLGLFCVFSFVIGLPLDEDFHFYRAYELSEGQLFPCMNGNMKLPDNVTRIINSAFETQNNYKREAEYFLTQPSDQYIDYIGRADGNSLFSYIPHILAIWIGKIFHLPIIPMLFLCRIFGLITCVTIIYLCIKYIPFMKKLVFLIGLLPVTMQSFAGVSVDGITICTGIALVTYVLYFRYSTKRKLKWRDLLLITLICLVLSVTKVVYAPLCLLLFWIPKERFSSQKQKIWSIITLGTVTLLFILARLLFSTRPLFRFEHPELRFEFIFQQPLQYFIKIIQSICIALPELAESMTGKWLGVSMVDLLTPYNCVAIFMLILLCIEREKPIPSNLRIFARICFPLVTIGIYSSMFVIFSDLSRNTIEGVHGRYFLPMALLIPLACTPSSKVKKRELLRPGYLYIFSALSNAFMISAVICTFI